MMFAVLALGIGAMELGILVLIVLLVLGPSKLPQLGEGIGKMLRGFKKEMRQLDEERQADASRSDVAGGSPGEIDVTPRSPHNRDHDERKGA